MALRRAEDRAAAAILGFDRRPLARPAGGAASRLRVAPRCSARAARTTPWPGHTRQFRALQAEFAPDLVLTPQGLGNHVDHQQVIAAAVASFPADRTAFYRDTPYAIRNPTPSRCPRPGSVARTVEIGAVLDRKIAAAQAYASQIGFQFGGAARWPRRCARSPCARARGAGRAVHGCHRPWPGRLSGGHVLLRRRCYPAMPPTYCGATFA